jgi:hypothetical protein
LEQSSLLILQQEQPLTTKKCSEITPEQPLDKEINGLKRVKEEIAQ